MKCFKRIYGLSFAALLLVGCASAPKTKTDTVSAPPVSKTVKKEIIDDKGMSVGVSRPKWVEYAVESDYAKLGEDGEFEGKALYIAENKGKNLDILKSWVRNFEVQGKFSQALGNFVMTKTGANLEGSLNEPESETFLKELVASISKHSFSGLEQKKDYWVQVRTIDKEKKTVTDEYQYFVVYAIDKELLKEQFDIALGKVEAKTSKQKKIKDETISFMEETVVLSESF